MFGLERRIYEIERRLRDLDARAKRADDQSLEDAQRWATIPIRGRTLPPAPPPPPPGRLTACCSAPIPGILRIREYFNESLAFEYNAVWTNAGTTGFPASGGHWEGVRPVGSVVTKVYCTNYFGGPNYYWNLEQGGAYVGAHLVTCQPFRLEFQVPLTTLRFEVDPA